MAQLPGRFEILHRARQYHRRALCKFETDCTIVTDVMDERDFARFEFKMSFGRLSYIAQYLWLASI